MCAMPRIHCYGYMTKLAKHGASGVCWLTTFRQRVHSLSFLPFPPLYYCPLFPTLHWYPLSLPYLFSEHTSLLP